MGLFIFGLIIGAALGVAFMCLFQVYRDKESRHE